MKNAVFAKLLFVIRFKFFRKIIAQINCLLLRAMGVTIGRNTVLHRCQFTWYHQVEIGSYCTIEPNVVFKFDGIYTEGPAIVIGDYTFIGTGCEFNISDGIIIGYHCAIASGCRFIDHNHGIETRQIYISKQPPVSAPITLEDDVWLGVNVVVLKGVHIGKGAVVGAGAVITKSIAPYEIWGGIPAQKIGERKGVNL
jgi:acetyltransferase-like isoleucine patch superfamily enzyme